MKKKSKKVIRSAYNGLLCGIIRHLHYMGTPREMRLPTTTQAGSGQ